MRRGVQADPPSSVAVRPECPKASLGQEPRNKLKLLSKDTPQPFQEGAGSRTEGASELRLPPSVSGSHQQNRPLQPLAAAALELPEMPQGKPQTSPYVEGKERLKRKADHS